MANYEENATDVPKLISEESTCSSVSSATSDNEMINKLLSEGIKQGDIDLFLKQGELYYHKPKVLAIILKIPIENAQNALEILKWFKQRILTEDETRKIENCLTDYPEIESAEDISLICDLPQNLVASYLESKPLSESQRNEINKLFNSGHSINDIMVELKILSRAKVDEYMDSTFLTFNGDEGQRILMIIKKQNVTLKTLTSFQIREMVKCRNLELQDQLCFILPQNDENDYSKIQKYFKKYDESKDFFEIDTELSIKDILVIKESNLDTEQLSIKLNKVETVIKRHLQQYIPNKAEKEYCANLQRKQIEELLVSFGKDTKTFHNYRTILSDFTKTDNLSADPVEAFGQLIPLIFYYLKCSLSFKDITAKIAESCKMTITTNDIFHLIFQLSDPVVRGLCIEHYSFSHPVPFYYPGILHKDNKVMFNLCTELWYSTQYYNGMVSFGLGRASWNPIGKSYLIDLIFETDFVEGNPQKSAFHLHCIDIQLTRNLFGEATIENESMKWAYIDCHTYSDPNVIKVICQHLDIALIHITYLDFSENLFQMNEDIQQFETCMKHLYVFVRDYEGSEVLIEKKSESKTFIFVPKLTNEDMTVYSSLNKIGYEVLHLKIKNPKLIGPEFIESVIGDLNNSNLEEIQTDKKLIETIMEYIREIPITTTGIEFSFLSYYPRFVDYMSLYYQVLCATDWEIIDDLNKQCVNLKKELQHIKMGDIVLVFNRILERNHSGIILWKLSQELSALTGQILLEFFFEKNDNKYSVEILWREALLTSKYGDKLDCQKDRNAYKKNFESSFSNHVERGEAFELIDGDNLRFFNKDINALLSQLYKKQSDGLKETNKSKRGSERQAPIVVSILGPQSSGKSTLLNYCFGCKFLTSAGRCTRGIYGSLSKLSQPVNHTNQFLILDTEGLDGGSRKGLSLITFDRTMVLFCLAVSQVVIINVIGDLGEKMQNLLQICGYSLHKLRVSKVMTPKLFFVLNQQADPDPNKHLASIHNLLDKLDEESELMELEGVKISDLIQVSKDNLFVLPSAFNQHSLKLFDSNFVKLSPTIPFAKRCSELRQAIINQLTDLSDNEILLFNTMSEWLEMSGVIWETIIKYQDIVKYRNVDELKSTNLLRRIVGELMSEHILCHQREFDKCAKQLISEIKGIDKLQTLYVILGDKMSRFDKVFNPYAEPCLIAFNDKCQRDPLLRKMAHISEDMRINLSRLIYIEKKKYQDKLKFQIKAVLTHIKQGEREAKFRETISKDVDRYLDLNVEEQTGVFESIWVDCFEDDGRKEQEIERNEDFENLYTIFKMESKTMENKQNIFELFRDFNFEMDKIIDFLQSQIHERFERDPQSFSTAEDFIYPWKETNLPIKEMTPFTGKVDFEYLGKDTLFRVDSSSGNETPIISDWVPTCCHPVVKYCSGYYNHPDIIWELEERKQIRLLASLLKDPNDIRVSTWSKLMKDIASKVQELIHDSHNLQSIVKQLVNYLCFVFKLVNYEINFIQAQLTIAAERTITTLIFAYAFKALLAMKTSGKLEGKVIRSEEKVPNLKYFLERIQNRKMARGDWNRKERRENDRKFANRSALAFLKIVSNSVKTDEQSNIENKFDERKESLSYANIHLRIEEKITEHLRLQPGVEILDQNNFVIQFICNRNEIVKNEFLIIWNELVDGLYNEILKSLKIKFTKQLARINAVLTTFWQYMERKSAEMQGTKGVEFDSDSIFAVVDKGSHEEVRIKESPLAAAMYFLQMYLDPNVDTLQLKQHFNKTLKVDGIKMKKKKNSYVLCDKPLDTSISLEHQTFNRLTSTKMFSEQIFNIYEYVREFWSVVSYTEFELSRAELGKILDDLRKDFESRVINCDHRCPSCSKFCERELHPHDGKCQVTTGHQICSMGGRVWENDRNRTAILLMCDDYTDETIVTESK